MKKRGLFIFLMLLFSFSFIIPAKASVFFDEVNYSSIEDKPFRAIRGIPFVPHDDAMAHLVYDIGYIFEDGYLEYNLVCRIGDDHESILSRYYFSNGQFTGLMLYVGDTLFYEIYDEYPDINIITDIELDVCELHNDNSIYWDPEDISVNGYGEFYDGYSNLDVKNISSDLKYYAFMYTEVTYYYIMDEYVDKDIHYIVDIENPKTISQIIEDIQITDFSSKTIKLYDNNTYTGENLKIDDQYSFRIIGIDESYNTTIQTIYVDVKDITPPKIIQLHEVYPVINQLITDEMLKSYFTLEVEEEVTYSFSMDEYKANYKKAGTYTGIAYATDSSGNVGSKEFKLIVEDTIAPMFYLESYSITLNTQSSKTKEEIEALFHAYDNNDGDITYKIDFTGIKEYLENTSSVGTYSIVGTVEDDAKNKAQATLTIYVIDEDYPTIEFTSPMIIVKKGEVITREQIIEFFKSRGYKIDENGVISDYFDSNTVEESYDLTIKDLDGQESHYTIASEDILDDVSYDIPVKEEKKDYKLLIIGISIASVILITCTILGIIIYKKKH